MYFLVGDQQGTAGLAVDASDVSSVTRRYYDPYGKPVGTAPADWPGNKGFVGGTTSTATGLTNLGAREYQPQSEQFITPDPLLDAYDPQDLNGYAYGADNPATESDPTGQAPYPGQGGSPCEQFAGMACPPNSGTNGTASSSSSGGTGGGAKPSGPNVNSGPSAGVVCNLPGNICDPNMTITKTDTQSAVTLWGEYTATLTVTITLGNGSVVTLTRGNDAESWNVSVSNQVLGSTVNASFDFKDLLTRASNKLNADASLQTPLATAKDGCVFCEANIPIQKGNPSVTATIGINSVSFTEDSTSSFTGQTPVTIDENLNVTGTLHRNTPEPYEGGRVPTGAAVGAAAATAVAGAGALIGQLLKLCGEGACAP